MILERINERRSILVDDRMVDWIACRIPGVNVENWRGFAQAIGVTLDGEIIAGFAVSSVSNGNAELSIAADTPRWATRETIRRLMRWPFVQLNCHRVTARSAASNLRAIRFNEGIGFKREGLIREGWGPGMDCVVMGLLKSEAPQWMLAATPEIA